MGNLPTFTMNINPMKVDIPVPGMPREIDDIHFYEGKLSAELSLSTLNPMVRQGPMYTLPQ